MEIDKEIDKEIKEEWGKTNEKIENYIDTLKKKYYFINEDYSQNIGLLLYEFIDNTAQKDIKNMKQYINKIKPSYHIKKILENVNEAMEIAKESYVNENNKEEFETLKKQISTLETAKREFEIAQEQFKPAEKTFEIAQEQFKSAEKTFMEFQNEINNIQENIKSQEQKLEKLMKEVDEFQEQIGKAEANLKELFSQQKDTLEKHGKLYDEITKAKKEATQKLKDAEEKFQKAKSTKDEAEKKFQKVKSTKDEAEKKFQQASKNFNNIINNIDKFIDNIEKQADEKDNQKIQNVINEIQEIFDNAEAKYDVKKRELADALNQHIEIKTLMQKENALERQQIYNLLIPLKEKLDNIAQLLLWDNKDVEYLKEALYKNNKIAQKTITNRVNKNLRFKNNMKKNINAVKNTVSIEQLLGKIKKAKQINLIQEAQIIQKAQTKANYNKHRRKQYLSKLEEEALQRLLNNKNRHQSQLGDDYHEQIVKNNKRILHEKQKEYKKNDKFYNQLKEKADIEDSKRDAEKRKKVYQIKHNQSQLGDDYHEQIVKNNKRILHEKQKEYEENDKFYNQLKEKANIEDSKRDAEKRKKVYQQLIDQQKKDAKYNLKNTQKLPKLLNNQFQ